jgi:hypothetical protein
MKPMFEPIEREITLDEGQIFNVKTNLTKISKIEND